jgi:hypothetical protein
MGSAFGSGLFGSGYFGGVFPGYPWDFDGQMGALNSTPIILVEIEFGDMIRYYSNVDARFESRFYEGRLLQAGSVRRALQQNLGLFEIASIEIFLSNTDQYFSALITNTKVKGVVARVRLGTKALPLSLYETVFEGTVDDFGTTNFGFRLLIRDKLWTMPPKPLSGYVTATVFPFALPADAGKPLPICYGSHSDTDTTDAKNRGAWPTLFVDNRTGSRRFLIAAHAVKAINEVYAWTPGRGSLLMTITTHYTAHPAGIIDGVRYAYIEITATGWSNYVTDSAGNLGIVTVNVDGKETSGDGTGDLIENPIAILRDVLANYLGAPTLNGASFDMAEVIATERNYIAAGGYIVEKSKDEFIREICDSFNIRIYPDYNGNVSVSIFKPISPVASGLQVTENWEVLRGTFSADFQSDIQGAEDAQIVNVVEAKYKYHWGKQFFRETLTAEDVTSQTTYGPKKLAIDMYWSVDADSSEDVSARIVTLYRNPVANIRCKVPLLGMNLELTDLVSVTHADGPAEGGYNARTLELIEHTFNPQDMTVEIKAKDVEAIAGSAFFLDDEDLRMIPVTGLANVFVTDDTIQFSLDVGVFGDYDIEAGDIIQILDQDNEENLMSLAIISFTDDTITTSYSGWVNQSNIEFKIFKSYSNATGDQLLSGHVCGDDNEFLNGDGGLTLS